MTLTFKNHNEVIVYALEKIIDYARKNQYIFVAQSVWWIASMIVLTEGLVIHIDNIRIRSKADQVPTSEVKQIPSVKEVSATPRELQADLKNSNSTSYVHLDRISRINQDSDNCRSENSDSELNQASRVIKETREFLNKSRKERKQLRGKQDQLSRIRSGKIPEKPLTRKQENRLGAISKNTLVKYLDGRKK